MNILFFGCIIFLLFNGINFLASFDKDIKSVKAAEFKNNYCDRIYTKSDLLDPKIWNPEKFKQDSDIFSYWQLQKVGMVEECVDVVKYYPEEMTMELKGRITSSLVTGIDLKVQLKNIRQNTTYDISTSGDFLDNSITITPNDDRSTKLFHWNNIRTFFRTEANLILILQ